jgi:hypothetical protein
MHLSTTSIKHWHGLLATLIVITVLCAVLGITHATSAEQRTPNTLTQHATDRSVPAAPAGPRGPISLTCVPGQAAVIAARGPAGPQGPVGVPCAPAAHG